MMSVWRSRRSSLICSLLTRSRVVKSASRPQASGMKPRNRSTPRRGVAHSSLSLASCSSAHSIHQRGTRGPGPAQGAGTLFRDPVARGVLSVEAQPPKTSGMSRWRAYSSSHTAAYAAWISASLLWYAGSPPDSVMVSGRWMYRSTLYEDTLMRVRVDGEDLPARWDLVWVQVPCLAGVAERHA